MGVNTRAIVLDMLAQMTERKEYSHVVMKAVLDKYNYLDPQDKAFMKRLCEGCVERSLQLDYILNQFSKTKTKKMKPVILLILRMGVYQILFMDGVPDSAACNEAVMLAEKRGLSGLKGFVNGVLRNISRQKETISYPDQTKEPLAALSIRYSMPEWITERYLERFGAEITEQILEYYMEQQPVTVRMNEQLNAEHRKSILEQIRKAGITVTQHPLLPYAFHMSGMSGMNSVPGFAEGIWNVQDVSSMLVSEIAGICEGMTILDVCAAPGGKSLHAACKLRGTGHVDSRDVSEFKTAFIEENITRNHAVNISTRIQDARVLRTEDTESADIVYVDAPCSGLGIIGKKCDLRYHVSPEQLTEIVVLQKEILNTAVQYVKKGGILIYSTCTVNEDENEAQVAYLTSQKGFMAESLNPYLPQCLRSDTTEQGYLQLLPGIHGTDGFFMARLRKK